MAKRIIHVGIENKSAFDSICALINGNCFDGLTYSVKNGVISDGEYEYVLTTKKSEKKDEQKFVFEKDGASWFKSLRGEKAPDDDAIWNTFRSNVAIEYHKRFSVVEYKKQAPTKEETLKALKFATDSINDFCAVFYPFLKGKLDVRPVTQNEFNAEDIYGVAVKIELSGGTGASLPVLGRVFFSRTGKVMSPLTVDVATPLDQNIKSLIPDESEENAPSINTSVIDNALDAMQALIENTDKNFADYLCFSDKEDLQAVNGLLEKLSHNDIELECQRVDVLYITHIQTTPFNYIVYSQNKPLFHLTVGINDSITISCASCSENTLLVERNQIVYENALNKKTNCYLDFNLNNLGLTAEEINEVLSFSNLSKHIKPLSCKKSTGATICSCYKCESQIFLAVKGEKEKYACLDCPYPEIVYINKNGEPLYTPKLTFAFDKKELVSSDTQTAFCSNCGRAFSKETLLGGLCRTCRGVGNDSVEKAKKLYKEYKDFLPLTSRLTLSTKKYCYEDDEIILFLVGKRQYIFNKLTIKEFGYVKKPKRIK